ncbi:hypothetical protein Y032_1011g3389 [Ancylostoma ceylanicum]|uniref:Uncharacterized protein n=1 Tax=Ancylostoma ceylanicum TaxID=53326 RepID=A0A016W7Q9_9BILA|nr:hypothetical protein Y032_1011g3389 [Ancylostoma ceylanicum]
MFIFTRKGTKIRLQLTIWPILLCLILCRAPMLRGAAANLITVASTTEQVRRGCVYRSPIAPALWWMLQYSRVGEGCAFSVEIEEGAESENTIDCVKTY